MPDTVLNLLIQVPLVGIFVWSNLQTMKMLDAREEKRDKAYADERASRDTAWREFLAEHRFQNNAAISRIADEVKSNSLEIAKMNSMLYAHDSAAKERASSHRI